MNVGIFANPDGRGGTTLATAELFSAGFYAKDRIVLSPISYQFYVKKVAGNTSTDPSADSTNWAMIGHAVKSLQRGTLTISAGTGTATLGTAVSSDLSKSKLTLLGSSSNAGASAALADDTFRIALTNTTTITATKNGVINTLVISWELEERW